MTPSVAPTSPRYARQRVLEGVGADGQRRLADAHVVVIGAGGLGSALLPSLAAAGIGRLTVVDDGAVAESDLHRQTLYRATDVGAPKAAAAVAAIRSISPGTDAVSHPRRFDADVADDLLRDADLLVDASDNSVARYLADDAAARRGIPLVWGSALGWSGQVGVASGEAGAVYRDLVPEGDAVEDSCETVGVLPAACVVIGGMMAAEVLKLLLGAGDPLVGRAQVYDARSGRVRELAFRREPGTRPGAATPRRAAHPDASVLDAPALAAELASPTPPRLIDVREPWEAQVAAIPGAELLPLGSLADRAGRLDPSEPIVLYCHHGTRSAQALELLRGRGFAEVRHLAGGIDAWSTEVDPGTPRY